MYGVIDIGSNTIRLVVYKLENNRILPMINKKFSVGLAGYVDANNNLNKLGIEKAIRSLKEFREILNYIQIKEIFPFATASLRNIDNSAAVLEKIKEETGFDIRLLSGTEEATFDYYGVLQSVNIESGLMVDIGGGSTELVFFKDREIICTESLPIGSLNLYKKHIEGLIPTKKELKDIKQIVKQHLDNLKLPESPLICQPICGVGGTARATQKLLQDMEFLYTNEYNAELLQKLQNILKEDSAMFYDNLLKSSPDRVHTFAPGLIVLNTIAKHYDSHSIITSDYGVREGYLFYLLQERGLIHHG